VCGGLISGAGNARGASAFRAPPIAASQAPQREPAPRCRLLRHRHAASLSPGTHGPRENRESRS
jgi:hypothetical protein